ncbi:hypothetical protein Ancab_011415 [Ancistrocladus abbreviatus]
MTTGSEDDGVKSSMKEGQFLKGNDNDFLEDLESRLCREEEEKDPPLQTFPIKVKKHIRHGGMPLQSNLLAGLSSVRVLLNVCTKSGIDVGNGYYFVQFYVKMITTLLCLKLLGASMGITWRLANGKLSLTLTILPLRT